MQNEVTLLTIQNKFTDLIASLQGDSSAKIDHCSSSEAATKSSLCFVPDEKSWNLASQGEAICFVVPLQLKDKLQTDKRNFLYSRNHSLTHAQIVEFIHGRYLSSASEIDPTATISPSATLGQNVKVGAHSVIGDNAVIGDEVSIGANCVIEANSRIGKLSHIWPMVFIARGSIIGEDCHIHPNTTVGSEGYGFAHDQKGRHFRIPQLGNVVLENRVEVGANVTIDRATFGSTTIGEGTKLDNMIHIAHNVKVGKNCLLAGGIIIGGTSTLGDNVYSGGDVVISDHVNICSNVRLAGGSGVSNHITEPGDYGGYPLQPVRDYLKTTMCLPHLPEFRKLLKQLESDVRKMKPL